MSVETSSAEPVAPASEFGVVAALSRACVGLDTPAALICAAGATLRQRLGCRRVSLLRPTADGDWWEVVAGGRPGIVGAAAAELPPVWQLGPEEIVCERDGTQSVVLASTSGRSAGLLRLTPPSGGWAPAPSDSLLLAVASIVVLALGAVEARDENAAGAGAGANLSIGLGDRGAFRERLRAERADALRDAFALSPPAPGGHARSPLAAPALDRTAALTVRALVAAVDAKDAYTQHHSRRVGALAAAVALELGLEVPIACHVGLAGLLHDVGKIGIPSSILTKPGGLTDCEWLELRTHVIVGERILRGAGLSSIAGWVRHHHERVDGLGYPEGLVGARIPLPSRILLVADAYDAMVSDRSYRRGIEHDAALAEISRMAGSQFDADCAAALTDAMASAPGLRSEEGRQMAKL